MVSAIGVAGCAPGVVYSDGIANILTAMQPAGVRRMLCISATGLDPGHPLQHWVAKPLRWVVFRNMYTHLARMEERVKSRTVDWTTVRPPQLTDGPLTGRYTSSLNAHLPAA